MKKSLLIFLITTALMACKHEPKQTIELIQAPSKDNSSLPRLTTDSKGDIYLSWVEKGPEKSSELFYSRLNNDSWNTPQSIAQGNDWFVNWADFPSLMVNGEQMAAHWLQKSDLGTYDYDVRVSFSKNHGDSWGASIIPHKDNVAAEHGFVSMLPMENGKTFITWLDGRNTKGGEHSEAGHGGGGAMTLRAGIFDQNGETLEEWELDDRICDCCQTGAAMTTNGPIVVYRDRSEMEIRDMSIVRYENGSWTSPQSVAIELWEIPGCPVNGPSITANGDDVATAWFTAKGGTPQVKMAFSSDAGATFEAPIIISQAITNGRVGIRFLENGSVAVSWMDTIGEMAKIMVANYDKKGNLLKKVTVAETSSARASGFPVLTTSGNDIYMAWTDVGEITTVKTAKINL